MATINDVARAAGVSRSTVSRVLNGQISSSTARAKVEKAIAETGYRANAHARSLASGKSNVYAAILTEPYGELFDDPTFGRMLQGINSALVGSDIALNLLFATTDEERERTLRQLAPNRVDGALLLSPHIDDPLLDAMSTEIPTIALGPLIEGREHTWTVTIDDRHGGELGAAHLNERGARRVAIIAGPDTAQGAHNRVDGQTSALHNPPLEVIHAPYSTGGGAFATRELLVRHPDVDGILCGSDRQALGVLAVLHEAGRSIPDDVKVVGFDDHAFAAETAPALTTISQPIFDVGASGARLLNALGDAQPIESLTLPTSLVVRETT
ncbi:LacI family DNA-binding transcriptional regulator [Dermabacter hominis]|uniref:LacI family DNA-binding transcriptional regulator n=1 Tax=Dermabacter hominis TaxID=36740 RepID=UPI0021A7FBE3|nr:LacI family DNA-binding transcriptional regulator [Dermabacter hominis]MCT1715685.1 LacI family transcriptional regulator [Dermabacter hominis]MCT1789146.1 LacI family transcriptional regulator [Dermabacter hominis]